MNVLKGILRVRPRSRLGRERSTVGRVRGCPGQFGSTQDAGATLT